MDFFSSASFKVFGPGLGEISSSVMVSHSLHCVHRPIHAEEVAPQLEHTYLDLALDMEKTLWSTGNSQK